ncbi:MAG TPA: gliding motility lipoprotein GldD [Bacteroidales bacterium]|nr:gliding motility lipoprotein GldD [Bacteroidales bacterium]
MLIIPKRRILFFFLPVIFILASCRPAPVPKPQAFFRIDLPEKEYRRFDQGFPYSFEYPVYANISKVSYASAEPWWINVEVPQFKASIHISYKEINNNLAEYLNDTHQLLSKQFTKAAGIREDMILNENENVYGVIYHIRGPGVASASQFFVTDSLNHFLRGALYFNAIPNNDSLAPVIEFLKEDILHLVETLRWN